MFSQCFVLIFNQISFTINRGGVASDFGSPFRSFIRRIRNVRYNKL